MSSIPSPRGDPAGSAPTFTLVQLQELIAAMRSTTASSTVHADPTKPRVGGIQGTAGDRDAWTGGSNLSDSALDAPASIKAIRPSQYKFKKGTQETCEKGIRDSDHLGRANDAGTKEKPAITLTSWLTTIDKHLISTGMDTIFRVLIWSGTRYEERYLLKEWGNLSKSEVGNWVKELLEEGVRDIKTDSTGATRHDVCAYDKQNLEMSSVFLRDSIKTDLWTKIERSLPDKATGPEILYRVIHEHQAQGATVLRNLEDELRKLKLASEPAEDVVAHANKVTEIARRIVGSGAPPKDLNLLVANTFVDSTTKQFELEALRIVNEIDRDNKSYDWYTVIDELTVKYESLVQRKQWVALRTKKEDPVQALQAQVKELKRTVNSSKGGNSSKSGGTDTRTCYHCNEKGHIAPNCPKKNEKNTKHNGKESNKVRSDGGNKPSDGKDKKPKADRIPPKEHEPKTKTIDGTEWSWCDKCKRWTKGPKKHTTEEHKSKEELAGHPTSNLASTENDSGFRLVGGLFLASTTTRWCFDCNAHVDHPLNDCPNAPNASNDIGWESVTPRQPCRNCSNLVTESDSDLCDKCGKKRKCAELRGLMLPYLSPEARRRHDQRQNEAFRGESQGVLKD